MYNWYFFLKNRLLLIYVWFNSHKCKDDILLNLSLWKLKFCRLIIWVVIIFFSCMEAVFNKVFLKESKLLWNVDNCSCHIVELRTRQRVGNCTCRFNPFPGKIHSSSVSMLLLIMASPYSVVLAVISRARDLPTAARFLSL